MEALLSTISEIQNEIYVNERLFTNINRGGCGFFAALLKEKLEKLNIKSEFIYLDNYGDLPNTSRKMIENIYDTDRNSSCSHVLLKVGKYYIDGKVTYKGMKDVRCKWDMSYKLKFNMEANDYLTHALFNKPWQWNREFCNKTDYKNLKKIIDNKFKTLGV